MPREVSRAEHLLGVLVHNETPCEDDTRYTRDYLGRAQVQQMAAICNECPLIDACAEYADLIRPQAGVWAGVLYGRFGAGQGVGPRTAQEKAG